MLVRKANREDPDQTLLRMHDYPNSDQLIIASQGYNLYRLAEIHHLFSRDSMQNHNSVKILKLQSAGVTLIIRSRSPESN